MIKPGTCLFLPMIPLNGLPYRLTVHYPCLVCISHNRFLMSDKAKTSSDAEVCEALSKLKNMPAKSRRPFPQLSQAAGGGALLPNSTARADAALSAYGPASNHQPPTNSHHQGPSSLPPLPLQQPPLLASSGTPGRLTPAQHMARYLAAKAALGASAGAGAVHGHRDVLAGKGEGHGHPPSSSFTCNPAPALAAAEMGTPQLGPAATSSYGSRASGYGQTANDYIVGYAPTDNGYGPTANDYASPVEHHLVPDQNELQSYQALLGLDADVLDMLGNAGWLVG